MAQTIAEAREIVAPQTTRLATEMFIPPAVYYKSRRRFGFAHGRFSMGSALLVRRNAGVQGRVGIFSAAASGSIPLLSNILWESGWLNRLKRLPTCKNRHAMADNLALSAGFCHTGPDD